MPQAVALQRRTEVATAITAEGKVTGPGSAGPSQSAWCVWMRVKHPTTALGVGTASLLVLGEVFAAPLCGSRTGWRAFFPVEVTPGRDPPSGGVNT